MFLKCSQHIFSNRKYLDESAHQNLFQIYETFQTYIYNSCDHIKKTYTNYSSGHSIHFTFVILYMLYLSFCPKLGQQYSHKKFILATVALTIVLIKTMQPEVINELQLPLKQHSRRSTCTNRYPYIHTCLMEHIRVTFYKDPSSSEILSVHSHTSIDIYTLSTHYKLYQLQILLVQELGLGQTRRMKNPI